MGNLKGQGNECYNVTTPLGMPYPAQFGHLKKNKKETHVKFLESICLSVTFISAGQKFRERDFQQ